MKTNMKLLIRAFSRYLMGLFLVLALIFVPAGTPGFYNGWLLIVLLFVPMLAAGIIMMLKNPELLAKRLSIREKEDEQQSVIRMSALMFIASFIAAGLNYRFRWHLLPEWLVYAASVVFIISYAGFAEVLRENVYLSRTIEVQEDQKVIDTGLYGVVRHPMYTATLFLFLSMPLILGSLISFVIMLAYIPIINKRINNEEKVLEEELAGYADYKQRVKYKLIPYLW